MNSPLCLLLTKYSGTWMPKQTVKSCLGIAAKKIVFVRNPSPAEKQQIALCLIPECQDQIYYLEDLTETPQTFEDQA